jgi:phosphocarrier protein HPr
MLETEIKVIHPTGLHARPAALFVQAAKVFASKITIGYDGKSADAKSIMGIMSLGIKSETVFKLSAEGADEIDAIAKLKALVESNFAEG